jgi:K+-sensing histidine kinase KdpD
VGQYQRFDTGPGIPRADLSSVFDDFTVLTMKSHATPEAPVSARLVKKFAAASGGTVKAVNNDGAGCTITISLPDSRAVKFSVSIRSEGFLSKYTAV